MSTDTVERVGDETTIHLTRLKGHHRFYELLAQIAQLHSLKNQDYADSEQDPLSNFRACERAGIDAYDGLLTRLTDKQSRIERLAAKRRKGQGAAVKGESVVDTHMDAAVYNLLGIVLYEEREHRASLASQEAAELIRRETEDGWNEKRREVYATLGGRP